MAGRSRPAAGGGRWVDVAPERIERWLAGFAERHGDPVACGTADGLRLVAPDGAVAQCHLPFGWPAGPGEDAAAVSVAAAHQWRVGLLLVRRGAHAIGVAVGDRLIVSKVDTRYVQSRTAAGGWSQQRFARRRGNQTRESAESASGHMVRLLEPERHGLAGLATGGDRALVDAVLADRRLSWLSDLPRTVLLEVPEPRRATLLAAVQEYRVVRIRVTDPGQNEHLQGIGDPAV